MGETRNFEQMNKCKIRQYLKQLLMFVLCITKCYYDTDNVV